MKLKTNLILLCCIVAILCPQYPYALSFSENQVKAAFMYKVTKFIRWENAGNNTKLCFLGDKEDSAGETISKTLTYLADKDKAKFNISKNTPMKDIASCNMIFIGSKLEPTLQDILAVLNNKPIVTISDIDSFTRRGGMFGYYNKDGVVSIELNYSNARNHNINLNSALRELITVVE